MEVKMNQMILSIFLILIGLIVGFGLTVIYNSLREKNTTDKINKMLEEAQKNADKLKRDAIN